LTHRLRVAGCELPLFEPASVEAIFQATQALPRKVNRLAHYALVSTNVIIPICANLKFPTLRHFG
jgi:type II secretory pathway predicted ATPase ExeA